MSTIAKVKRANGSAYQARVKSRGRLIKTKTFRTKTAARDWARRYEADLDLDSALADPGRRTRFDELCDRYTDEYAGRDHHRLFQVNWWQKRLAQTRLSEISLEGIRGHLNEYRLGLDRDPVAPRTPASTNRMKAALSALFTFGIKRGLALKNPVRLIPAETENNHRIRYLTDDERFRLLTACRQSYWDRLYLLVLMALMTGARRGELLSLRWEWIDFSARSVTLEQTKNGQPRVLPLPMPVIEELMCHRRPEGLVFASGRSVNRPADIKSPWRKALIAAAVEDFRFHDLRHSAASYLAMGGASLLEVAEVLGHRSLQTTKRYAHLSIAHKQDLTDRLLGSLETGGTDGAR